MRTPREFGLGSDDIMDAVLEVSSAHPAGDCDVVKIA